MSKPVIEVEGLSKKYRTGLVGATTLREDLNRLSRRLRGAAETADPGEFWALRDVSFSIQPGEVVGVIGRNGAGKSTLLKILSRITEPTTGRAILRGRVVSLLEVGTGFHPDLTGRENVFLNGAILGMRRAEIAKRFDEIVAFAEIDKFIDTPIKHYSSGMGVRLAFAVAAFLESEILIIDEVLAVGDLAFQQRCIRHVSELAAKKSRAVLLVSHQAAIMQQLADSGLLLERGRVTARGDISAVLEKHAHTNLAHQKCIRWSLPDAPGDDRCRLTQFQLIEPTPATPDNYQVELHTWVEQPVRDLCAGFDLISQRDGIILRSYHNDRIDGPELQKGANILRCTLPAAILKEGTYEVHARIGIHNVAWVVNQAEPLSFTLNRARPEASSLWHQSTRPGAINPVLTWDRS